MEIETDLGFCNIISDLDRLAQSIIDSAKQVKPEELGLDNRAGYKLFILEDDRVIAVENSNRSSLDYYGGFEYIEGEDVVSIGPYTFYMDSSERVADCFKYYYEKAK